MIKIENVEVVGWAHAIRGMRNPYDSWDKTDSALVIEPDKIEFHIGNADHQLMDTLLKSGTDHSKFMRFVVCYMDITAPLYWWKEFDTYRVGVEKDSCSTMHTICRKPFTLEDFSTDHMTELSKATLQNLCVGLNQMRNIFLKYLNGDEKREAWWQIIQLLPSSYMQKRTVMCSYQALRNMYHARKYHKLTEWHVFCKVLENLENAELITND